jgi:hypothetical protein
VDLFVVGLQQEHHTQAALVGQLLVVTIMQLAEEGVVFSAWLVVMRGVQPAVVLLDGTLLLAMQEEISSAV